MTLHVFTLPVFCNALSYFRFSGLKHMKDLETNFGFLPFQLSRKVVSVQLEDFVQILF